MVTYDDDLEGKRVGKYFNGQNIYPFKIPSKPVVTYKDGQRGGSFEEAFCIQNFLESCFQPGVLSGGFCGTQAEFTNCIDPGKPWFGQLAEYVTANGG